MFYLFLGLRFQVLMPLEILNPLFLGSVEKIATLTLTNFSSPPVHHKLHLMAAQFPVRSIL